MYRYTMLKHSLAKKNENRSVLVSKAETFRKTDGLNNLRYIHSIMFNHTQS